MLNLNLIIVYILINPDKAEETKKVIKWISNLNIIAILNIMNFKYKIKHISSFLIIVFSISNTYYYWSSQYANCLFAIFQYLYF